MKMLFIFKTKQLLLCLLVIVGIIPFIAFAGLVPADVVSDPTLVDPSVLSPISTQCQSVPISFFSDVRVTHDQVVTGLWMITKTWGGAFLFRLAVWAFRPMTK